MERPTHPYAQIAEELAGTAFSAITYVAETDSTNADASRLLGDDRYLGLSIVAEHQRRGQGRKGRSWTSSPDTSLLVTTILPRAVAATALWAVPFWVALAVHRALTETRRRDHRSLAERSADSRPRKGGRASSASLGSAERRRGSRVASGLTFTVPHVQRDDIDPPPAYCDDVADIRSRRSAANHPARIRRLVGRAGGSAAHGPFVGGRRRTSRRALPDPQRWRNESLRRQRLCAWPPAAV